ncbi:hypothetical protein SAMN06297251_10123 [Fulvimarina manganoxydans]|uniref:Uncharacterized protein n=1 Tax=Fulvimarina manganoxydans TaxID=937218 RepID=A0A1W1Y898_9HYPH|nr:hypothetical protein [Fulvimarina manganoxydans]SMC32376.1 hypothetical protein SAMN06297251_10123 [Fulvimarina manganoxydans]
MKTIFTVEHRDGQHPLVGFTDAEGYVLPPRPVSSIEFEFDDRFTVRGIEEVVKREQAEPEATEDPIDLHTRIREMLETAAAAYRLSRDIGGDGKDAARMARTADDLHAEARRLAGLQEAV